MGAEPVVWRLGLAPELLHERSEQLRDHARRREELATLFAHELDLVLEQRARVRGMNRRRGELGCEAFDVPELPRRVLPPGTSATLSAYRWADFVDSAPPRVLATELGDSIIEGRIVEYGRRVLVADPPSYIPYAEEFAEGAVEVGQPVPLVFERDDDAIGRAVSFQDRPDGLYACCRLTRSHEQTVRDLIAAGMLVALTPVFTAIKTKRLGRVVVRERARLVAISLCRWPVYRDSEIAIT
jgi:hypothetical protein